MLTKHDRNWIDEPSYTKIKALLPLPCVDLLVVHEGQLLLMLRNNHPAKDTWFTPGGRVYKGEMLEQAVHRVLLRETGLEPLTLEQKGAMSHLWLQEHTVTVFYLVTVATSKVTLNTEHRDYKWISRSSDNLHPYVREMIQRAKLFDSH